MNKNRRYAYTEMQIQHLDQLLTKCRGHVWLLSAAGEQYDLRDFSEKCLAFSRLLTDMKCEMEFFASDISDQLLIGRYISNCRKGAEMAV